MCVSVVEESVEERRRMNEWMAIEANLASEDLREMMPREEWRGLTLLVSVLHSSKACTSIERGRIVALYDKEVEVVLMFESMLIRRIDWLAANSGTNPLVKPDCHLPIIVRRRSTMSGQILHPHERDLWSTSPCIVATGAEGLPVTDLASSFVLWADSGFKREPETLVEQVALVKGPESYEEFLEDKKRRDRERRLRLENLRRRSVMEATRRHHDEEQRRLLQDELDRISAMGWRELMEMERDLANSPWGVNQSIRAASQAILYPEEGGI